MALRLQTMGGGGVEERHKHRNDGWQRQGLLNATSVGGSGAASSNLKGAAPGGGEKRAPANANYRRNQHRTDKKVNAEPYRVVPAD